MRSWGNCPSRAIWFLKIPPEANQPATYEFQRDDRTKALQSEYALISLLPSVTPNQYILVLAGLSTLGTQAAAEFATSEASMLTLEKMWAASGDKDLHPISRRCLRSRSATASR